MTAILDECRNVYNNLEIGPTKYQVSLIYFSDSWEDFNQNKPYLHKAKKTICVFRVNGSCN